MGQSHEMRIMLADNQAGTTNPISLAVQGVDLLGTPEFGEDVGFRGTRQPYECGARLLKEVVAGGFEFQPTAAQLDWLLERCMGDAIATYPAAAVTPGETLPEIYVYVDKGVEIYRYDNCVIGRLGFSLRQNDYLKVRVDLVGKNETAGVTYPVGAPAIACASEYVASDVAFTLGGTTFPFKSLDWTIDNKIAADQHENALYRTIFESEGLDIMINATMGWRADTLAMYRRAIAGSVATIVMADGTATYTWSFANVKVPGQGPTVPASGEITQVPAMKAFRTTGTAMVTVTKT